MKILPTNQIKMTTWNQNLNYNKKQDEEDTEDEYEKLFNEVYKVETTETKNIKKENIDNKVSEKHNLSYLA